MDMELAARLPDEAGTTVMEKQNVPEENCCCQFKFFRVLIAVVSVCLAIGFIVIYFGYPATESDPEFWNSMKSHINWSVDPCDNFYQFACSGSTEEGSLSKAIISYYKDLFKVIKSYKSMLDITPQEFNAINYFQLCVSQQSEWADSTSGATELINYAIKLGGFSFLGGIEPNKDDSDFTRMLQLFNHEHFADAIFSLVPEIDLKNSSQYILNIDVVSGLMFADPNDYNDDEAINNLVEDNLAKFAVLLLGAKNNSVIRKGFKNMVHFEGQLASIITPKQNITNLQESYNPFSLKELQLLIPEISWLQYVKSAFGSESAMIVTEDMLVVVSDLNFLYKLEPLLNKTLETTEGRILIHDYMVWYTLRSISFETANRDIDFRNVSDRKTISGYCLVEVTELLPSATARLAKRELTNIPEKIIFAQEMLKEIKIVLKSNLLNLEWVTPELHQYGLQKLSQMTVKVGAASEEFSDANAEERLNITNYLNVQKYFQRNDRRRLMSRLEQNVKPTDLDLTMSTISVPAVYLFSLNRLLIFDAILQYPLIDLHYPLSVIYGKLGMILGHELIHSLDHNGIGFDLHGNLINWTNDAFTLKNFENVTKCLVEQYATYQSTDSVNNEETNMEDNRIQAIFCRDEIIADDGGLRAAYLAYKAALAKQNCTKENSKVSSSLKVTEDQLFFVSFAQIWCTTKTYDEHDANDSHAPNEFRANGPLSNFPAFSEVFQCKLGQKMNPDKKCLVW